MSIQKMLSNVQLLLVVITIVVSGCSTQQEREAPKVKPNEQREAANKTIMPTNSKSKDLNLSIDGKTKYAIVTTTDAGVAERNAAAELAFYLKEITGADFKITTLSESGNRPVIAVGPDAAKSLAPGLDMSKDGETGLGDDGIIIKTVDHNLILTGAEGSKRGTLYAVYEFLEQQLGVRWWTEEDSFVPKKANLTISALNIRYKPTFEYREALYKYLMQNAKNITAKRTKFLVQQRFNGHYCGIQENWGGRKTIALWAHSFDRFVSPLAYFKDHPEWFSMRKGKRKGKQLCCMNEEMITELTKNVLEYLRKHPEVKMLSISQNDNTGFCTCERCTAFNQEHGAVVSASLLYCINKVAEEVEKEFPDTVITTLAYWTTATAPEDICLRDNVIVRYAVDQRSGAMPVDSRINRKQMDDLIKWSKISSKLYIWDYVANMSGPYTPHPNLHVFSKDLKTYAANNVSGVLFQGDQMGSPTVLADFDYLKSYVISHLMWNPDIDEDAVINDFLNGYYGDAGSALKQYLDLLKKRAKTLNLDLHVTNGGLDASWLDLATMNRATEFFNNAENAVTTNPIQLQRVRKVRLPLDHQWIRGYKQYRYQAEHDNLDFKGPKDITVAVKEFVNRARKIAKGPVKFWSSGKGDYLVSIEKYGNNPQKEQKSSFGKFVSLNNILCPDIPINRSTDGEASFRYNCNFQKDYYTFAKYLGKTKMQWKKKPKDMSMKGMAGDYLTFKLTAPFSVKSIRAEAVIGNHADNKERTAYLEYSFDGKNYKIFSEKKYKSGARIKVSGSITFEKNRSSRFWIRIRKPAKMNRKYIILKNLDINVTGSGKCTFVNSMRASLNDIECNDIPVERLPDGECFFSYNQDLQKNNLDWKEHISKTDMRWNEWQNTQRKTMNGMVGNYLTYKLTVPFTVNAINAEAIIGNHLNHKERTVYLEYSFDGENYEILAEKQYKAGSKIKIAGSLEFEESKPQTIWLRFRKPVQNKSPYMMLKHVFFKVSGFLQKQAPKKEDE